MKRYLVFFICIWMIISPACRPLNNPEEGGTEEPEALFLKGLKVSLDTLFIKEGDIVEIKGEVIPKELSSEVPVKWMSSDESIVKVDGFGNVTALDYGFTTIEVSASRYNEWYKETVYSQTIPVYVSFKDTPIPNPEEMYRSWLGCWGLSGPVYLGHRSYFGQEAGQPNYFACYEVSITELVPLESYRIVGWAQFEKSSQSGATFPGEPLVLTARFDKKTGRLCFIRSKAENYLQRDIYLSPGWDKSMHANHTYYMSKGFKSYGYPEDAIIAYARQENENEAIVRGAYNKYKGEWYYHLGMGFSNAEGTVLDEPMEFPVKMIRMPDVSVEEVTFSDPSLVMVVGTEHDMTITWSPSNAAGFKAKWFSSHPEVVAVSYSEADPLARGHLRALAPGRSDVTVSLGDFSASCEVVVKKPFIIFFFYYVRDMLCALWDTDGDGEIGYEEAAAVSSFGRPFHISDDDPFGANVWYFNELQYFTSLKELDAHCMELTYLYEVTIPANIKKIGAFAFADNPLKDVTFLGPPPQIGEAAFMALGTSFNMWVPDEFLDAYIKEASKEGSVWATYATCIRPVSERQTAPVFGGISTPLPS